MNRLLMIGAMLLGISGCTAHYHRLHGDDLFLYLNEPDAQKVYFACSLDGYQPHETYKEDGCWVIPIPGREPFRYFYLLDDSVYLPDCRLKEDDDFGTQNCIFDPRL